ncbi:MAG TPA: putative metal-binding motif-containing protein [Myxococcota bacterium]|nr:putative metal-binding motif-containing protein [Myxococcota bacterium]
MRTGSSGMLPVVAMACLFVSSCGSHVETADVGGSCREDSDCQSALCFADVCIDPLADQDWDGLSAGDEVEIGLDPFHPDSDRDGIPDGLEVGPELATPADYDGDGVIDALESAFSDSDGDCLPDQYDPLDALGPAGSSQMVPVLCMTAGVCGAAMNTIVATCDGSKVTCSYEGVPGWNAAEWMCDGKDNNCDGRTDEGFLHEGLSIGLPCLGAGSCGPGIVECDDSGFSTRCSSNPGASGDRSMPEVCDGLDNDCDGLTDNGMSWKGVPLGERCDGEGECGIGKVECLADRTASCSTMKGGSHEQIQEESCDNLDNDCDGRTDETFFGNASELCVPRGVCALFPNMISLKCEQGILKCDFSAVPGYSGSSEMFCDGQDDDCDGLVDEELSFAVTEPGAVIRLPGQSCGSGACAGGVVTCSPSSMSGMCSTTPLAAPEKCDGIDDDCDGYIDNGFALSWKPALETIMDREPQALVSSRMAVVEYSLEDPPEPGEPPAGIYVCGGAVGSPENGSSGISRRCWLYSFDSHRFDRLPDGPEVDSGAMVHDRAGGSLLMVGRLFASGEVAVFRMNGVDFGWSRLPWELESGEVLAAGVDPVENTLNILTNGDSGLLVSMVGLSDGSVLTVQAGERVSAGSFAAGSPSGGFVLFHACNELAGTVVEHVSPDGQVNGLPLAGQSPCMSFGAAVMPIPGRIVAIEGRALDGSVQATREFLLGDDLWHHERITVPGGQGSVMHPAMASSGDTVYAFSGEYGDGGALRRVIRLDRESTEWLVDSFVSGPSPRAGGVAFVSRLTAAAYFIGGYSDEPGGPQPVQDVWKIDLVNPRIGQIAVSGEPGAVIGAAAAINDSGQTAYIFGGLDSPPGPDSRPVSRFLRFNCIQSRFDSIQSGEGGPTARYGHSLVWAGDRLLLYGGLNDTGFLSDLWSWAPDEGWIFIGYFELSYGHQAFWDNPGKRMLVVGGRPGGGLRAYYPATSTWKSLLSGVLFDSYEGHGWFDEQSGSVLYLSSTSSDAVVVTFLEDGLVDQVIPGLQPDLIDAFVVYDPFGRRAMMLGGRDPSNGTVGTVSQIDQSCGR